jgi:cell division protein FtsZ
MYILHHNIVEPPATAKAEEPASLHFELKNETTEPAQPANQGDGSNPDNAFARNTGNSFLAKPSNIYAEPNKAETPNPMEATPATPPINELPELEMTLVMKDDVPETADESSHSQPPANAPIEDIAMQDDVEDQKRRAQERIQKLRNLSFNMNTADQNSEFDSVPAYIRRNMELHGNTLTSVENFYSKYNVKADENDKGQISSINTFLDYWPPQLSVLPM